MLQRPRLKSVLTTNMDNRSLYSAFLEFDLNTDTRKLNIPGHIYGVNEIDNFLDEVFEFLDLQVNQKKNIVKSISFQISGSPFSFSTEQHFDDACFELNLQVPHIYSKDLVLFLTHHQRPIEESIRKIMQDHDRYSARIYLESSFIMEKKDPSTGSVEFKEFHIVSKNRIYTRDEIPELIDNLNQTIVERFENTERGLAGSGWLLRRVKLAKIKICKFETSTIGRFKPYPTGLRGNHFIFNPKTEENCLLIALAGFLEFKRNENTEPKYITLRAKRNGYLFWHNNIVTGNLLEDDDNDGGELGFKWEKLPKLELLNKLGINIYNLSFSNGSYTIHMARKSSRKDFEQVFLLLIDGEHVCLIRDVKKFIRAFTHRNQVINHICTTCLSVFNTESDEKNHTSSCNSPSTILYPKPGTKKTFSKLQSLYPMPYVCFVDLESLNKKTEIHENDSLLATQHAFASQFKLIDLREKKTISKETYIGSSCIDDMLSNLNRIWESTRKSHKEFKIDWTPDKKKLHSKATRCSNCKVKFGSSKDSKKCAHHLHFKEKDNYDSALCSRCNRLFQEKKKTLIVLVHNLSYDWSLILKQASPEFVFKLNKRQGFHYYSGQFENLKFVDSLNMIKGSLSSLASEHIKNSGDLTYTKENLSHLSSEAQTLLLSSGKQFLPYEYLSSLETLQETSLPPKSDFYSSLTDSHISDDDYKHALHVWDVCKCETLLDYVQVYLDMDVGLLADVYLQWRETLLNLFGLDSLYFLTLASYAFEAFLWKTKVQLDCISDENLFQLITRNIRGGFCSVGKRYVRANNRHTNPNFKSGDKSNYLLYVDFNSLYPTTMSQFKLPQGEFYELNQDELRSFLDQDLCSIDTQGDYGYYLHIDSLPISPETARLTDSFPLCLSKLDIKESDISPHSQQLLEERGLKLPKPNQKLVAHHLGVKDYLICLPLLQFLLGKGLIIDKVHRVYKFKQSYFLKDFIDQNIKKRSEESNPFIKNALKLINNAIYGRTLLNQLNYSKETKVCTENIPLVKSFSKPNFHSVSFLSPNRALVTYNKSTVLADSPIYVGFSILDHAKLLTYQFWYDVLMKTYGDKVEFVYSDTDSFIINLETDDIEREIQGPLAPFLDLSNFPSDHKLFNNKFKGHLGKLKIETQNHHITQFVGLKPKMYSFMTTANNTPHNTLKGVPLYRRKEISFDQYLKCLTEGKTLKTDLTRLQFTKQEMSLIEMTKVALSSYEDKRYYFDNFKSVGYGHPACSEEREMDINDAANSQSSEGKIFTIIKYELLFI